MKDAKDSDEFCACKGTAVECRRYYLIELFEDPCFSSYAVREAARAGVEWLCKCECHTGDSQGAE
jgi:hypothetical protein